MTFSTAKAAVRYLRENPPAEPTFTLAISDTFSVAGEPDSIGAGMAVLLDAILARGYEPDGYEQKSGFRIYRYRKSDDL